MNIAGVGVESFETRACKAHNMHVRNRALHLKQYQVDLVMRVKPNRFACKQRKVGLVFRA